MKTTPMEQWILHKIGGATGEARPLTRSQIENYQLAKLRETIALAREKSLFYREVLSDFPADCFRSLSDLRELPFTTADDLRQHPHGFLCVSQDDISRVVTLESSGTTGAPKRVYFTAADQELTKDFFHHALPGISQPGDKVLILLPGERPGSAGRMFAESAHRMGVAAVVYGLVGDPEAALEFMAREKIDTLLGIPVQVLALASSEPPGENQFPIQVKNVILNTDSLPQAVAHRIKEKWGCRVFNHYATSEMGMAGGVDCEALAGHHLREADLLFEIVDPVTGEVLPDGEEGEVVFTTLTRRGMPLIRYRTGDMARFIPEPCPCGTVLKRLAPVRERVHGKIALAGGGALSMAMLDEAVFTVSGVLNFRAAISIHGHADRLEIIAQAAGWAKDETPELIRQALLTIPAVAANVDNGDLIVNPVALDQARELWRPVKRGIADLRSKERP